MDKTKVTIDISEAMRSLDRLDKAIGENDHRQIGTEIYRIRQRLHNLKKELGVVLATDDDFGKKR